MGKHKILLQGNYGCAGKLTDKCIKFIESKGKKYPDIMKCRHDKVLIEMFDKFAVEGYGKSRILWADPIDNNPNYKTYYVLAEIDSNIYCITDYDGAEYVSIPSDFNWVKIKE